MGVRLRPKYTVTLFTQELHKTDARIHETIFTKLYNFFSTPSLSRDIVIGTVIGLLAAGVIAGAMIASVGTAGIGPLVFGAMQTANSPESINKEPVLKPKPSTKFEKMYRRLYKAWNDQTEIAAGYFSPENGFNYRQSTNTNCSK
jgi:hypothetical protein